MRWESRCMASLRIVVPCDQSRSTPGRRIELRRRSAGALTGGIGRRRTAARCDRLLRRGTGRSPRLMSLFLMWIKLSVYSMLSP